MKLQYIYIIFLLPAAFAGSLYAQVIQFEDRSAIASVETAGGVHGVAVADYDGDGWEDVFLAASEGRSVLLRNRGGGTFEDATQSAGVAVGGNAVNPIWADIDNDGDSDLFVGVRSYVGATSRLFLNDGTGTFTDVSEASGIDLEAVVGSAVFGDYDNDGWVDLFVATRDSYDRLYRNTAGGSKLFLDVTASANVSGLDFSIAMQATWQDYDRDGDLDLFAVHDGNLESRIYKQKGGIPPFSDVTKETGLKVARSSMGIAWGDYDNDGWPDVYVTNIDQGNLFRNRGDGTFEDVTEATGTGLNGMSWGAVFADFDNDGDEDLFIGNTKDFDGRSSLLYENREGVFVNIASSAGASLSTNTFGVASGDFNRDGLIDLFVADVGGRNKLLINTTNGGGNWLSIDLEGVSRNRMAIGASVRIVAGDRHFFRTVEGGGSYCSQSSAHVHAGLGGTTRIDTLEIDWGGGLRQQFVGLEPNRRMKITEGGVVEVASLTESPVRFGVHLESGYPNPFASHADVFIGLSRAQNVRLRVYDVLGREVAVPLDRMMPEGRHRVVLDGSGWSPGPYLLRLESDRWRAGETLVMIKTR